MIVPMRKYSFLVYHHDYDQFLEQIRELGVVDVMERYAGADDATTEKLHQINRYREAITFLQRRNQLSQTANVEKDAQMVLDDILSLQSEQEHIKQQLNALRKELANVEPWGNFSVNTISKLQEAGIQTRFLQIPAKQYKPQWESEYYITLISTVQSISYFIALIPEGDQFDVNAEEIPMPELSLNDIKEQQNALNLRLNEIEEAFDRYARKYIPVLEKSILHIENALDDDFVRRNTSPEAEGSVQLIEGYVPQNSEEALIAYLNDASVVYIKQAPRVEDNKVPVLLKNNRFSKLFEPIGSLFSLPAYPEMDLTPYFAPFFMMFFGFCLGDAGYGLLILLGATFMKPRVKKDTKAFLSLAQFLGVGTIIFGILTGTLFGINLIEAEYAPLSGIKTYMLDSNKTFNLALGLGLFQILFAMVLRAINAIRQKGIAYAIATFGNMFLIIGIILALTLPPNIKMAGQVLIWTGVAMMVFWSDPKANIFARMGKGIWDLYSNITGIFGDLLSYIRLFALGVSSAILGFVINDIGLSIKGAHPILGPLFFVIFLIIGHTANLLISSLGSFVHPMRLTFVEFYKNAGFAGGGKAYKPFKNRK